MTVSGGSFSAADSAIGYLYQARMALLWALQRLPQGADFNVSLETLDDVVFHTSDGLPQELLQTKHHRNRAATLTDASPDLWKSVRIWFEGNASGKIPRGTNLYLLTTAEAPEASVPYKLRASTRDVEGALTALERTAQTSTNEANAVSYKRFLDTSLAKRRAIINDVFVIDAAESIEDLDGELKRVLFSAVDRKRMVPFLSRLEGWWLHRILIQLTSPGSRIAADEIEVQMSDLREQFHRDSLPIDDDLLNFSLDEVTQASHADYVFVRQIELTKASKERIVAAVRDFYRAFEQRSRWLREDLWPIGDIDRYERRLIEEWGLVFAAMKDKCGDLAAEEAKEGLSRDLLEWAEQTAPARIYVRPRVTEPFVTRGSLHMLADAMDVGWHPEFRDRLAILLQTKGRVA